MNIEDATIEQLEEEIRMRKDYESKNILLELNNILARANKKGIELFNDDDNGVDLAIKEFKLIGCQIYYTEKDV